MLLLISCMTRPAKGRPAGDLGCSGNLTNCQNARLFSLAKSRGYLLLQEVLLTVTHSTDTLSGVAQLGRAQGFTALDHCLRCRE